MSPEPHRQAERGAPERLRVLVTRPSGQAGPWVDRLHALGIDAAALPLIDIEPARAEQELAAIGHAWAAVPTYSLVVMVSPNAAEQFFARRPADLPWPPRVLAGSPGPGTTQALIRLGVPAAQIVAPASTASQSDSEALWEQLDKRDWQGARVLIVRGDGGRDWLADQLRSHGAEVRYLTAYHRAAPVWGSVEHALLAAAQALPERHLWIFSSSEAIDHLAVLARGADWSRALALTTHARIAARARSLGFARVAESRPAEGDVIACIQSFAT